MDKLSEWTCTPRAAPRRSTAPAGATSTFVSCPPPPEVLPSVVVAPEPSRPPRPPSRSIRSSESGATPAWPRREACQSRQVGIQAEVLEDAAHGSGLGDDGEHAQAASAVRAGEHVHLERARRRAPRGAGSVAASTYGTDGGGRGAGDRGAAVAELAGAGGDCTDGPGGGAVGGAAVGAAAVGTAGGGARALSGGGCRGLH